MDLTELIKALKRLKVETGSLACMGCGHEHNCDIHGCAIIRAALEQLEKMRWIPVTERLPEIKEHHVSDDVLVLLNDGGLGFCALEENIFGQTCFEIERVSPYGEESPYIVTHWRPMPEGPGGGLTCLNLSP